MASLLLQTLQNSTNSRTLAVDLTDATSDEALDMWFDEVAQLDAELAAANSAEEECVDNWNNYCNKVSEFEQHATNPAYARELASPFTAAVAGAYLAEGTGTPAGEEITLQGDSTQEITLQVFKRARDTLKRMVLWFVKLYNKITRKIYVWFQKHIGFVARAKKKNDSLRDRIGKMQGQVIDERKVELNGWATSLQIGGQLVGGVSDLVTGLGALTDVVTRYSEYLSAGAKNAEKMPIAITDIDGAGVAKFNEANKSATDTTYTTLTADAEFKKYKDVMEGMRDENNRAYSKLCSNINASPVSGDTRFTVGVENSTVKCLKTLGLLGNMNVFNVSTGDITTMSLAAAATAIRGRGLYVAEYKHDLKKTKNEGKLDTADLGSCETVISSLDQMLDEMGAIMNGDDMYAVRKQIDLANTNYEKKIKEFNSLEFTSNVRGILSVLAANITTARRTYTDTPMKLARLCRGTINAGQRYVSASLSNHKKAA